MGELRAGVQGGVRPVREYSSGYSRQVGKLGNGSIATGGVMPDKYQDEIEEILRRAGEVAPSDPSEGQEPPREERSNLAPRTRRSSAPRETTGRVWPRLSPGKLLLGGLIVFLVSALSGWTPGIWGGLVMLVVAYLLFFVTPRSLNSEKRWRGRSVDVYERPLDRIKRWFKS